MRAANDNHARTKRTRGILRYGHECSTDPERLKALWLAGIWIATRTPEECAALCQGRYYDRATYVRPTGG